MDFVSRLETDVFGKSTVTITQRQRSRALRNPAERSEQKKVLDSFLTGSPMTAERGLSRSSTAAHQGSDRALIASSMGRYGSRFKALDEWPWLGLLDHIDPDKIEYINALRVLASLQRPQVATLLHARTIA